MLPGLLIIGGMVVAGALCYRVEKKSKEKLIIEEKKIWNNGICDQCGKKWRLYWFYPPGSGGMYQYARLRCYKCKRETVLEAFKPPVQPSTQFSKIDRDNYK